MKIHILYPFVDGPWGGANQFLKAIKNYFISLNAYTEDENKADIILFNSSPSALLLLLLSKVYKLKKQNPNLIVINRIDGPVFLIRNKDLEIDTSFYKFNYSICDGTIFQSNWSKDQNYRLGLEKNNFETTILNAPNPNIFNKNNKIPFNKNRKIKIIATSWSNNWKKGFKTYKWLDENLDFSKYEMTFVGNSPVEFKNIVYKKPMNSENLALELKQHDIFITASQKDPCSNSLIEALHCGLPAIGLNDGGHPEIIGKGGEVFDTKEEILKSIEKIVNNYENYQNNINLPTIDEVGKMYYEFLEMIYKEQQTGNYKPKKFSLVDNLVIKKTLILWKINEKIKGIISRFFR
ncbi:glycosyltransferase [Hydrogenimonas thermophila]|uniref:Glycosyltransferase involved in cell wall bisynthesis n=1 Tax=Hydrogenimonas thermophila TaxID=223786 RepID=A0A1I5L8R4_9BACT|nr:glycosyltransferase [Hydrogenimonas thermophila]WOE70110.1 glycosyltransferase [Hydrogenimonas thermophila]WOE72627.1 glycosyltransferase [Hydrogenimonas thermophila]SFO93759.1 Glycosyltransferase involved in cell wall bisynthesis [Hydrogenimonas thermophila]